jgi:hypothetical protein
VVSLITRKPQIVAAALGALAVVDIACPPGHDDRGRATAVVPQAEVHEAARLLHRPSSRAAADDDPGRVRAA